MNLAPVIVDDHVIHRMSSHLLNLGWSPVSYEDIPMELYNNCLLNNSNRFMLFHKLLPGNVQAHIFLFYSKRNKCTDVEYCTSNTVRFKKTYGQSQVGLFEIELRPFIIKHSRMN